MTALSLIEGSLSINEGTPTAKIFSLKTESSKDTCKILNARLMNVKPTGNGRRESYAHLPMPRMTNTYMLGGSSSAKEIISSVEDGIYAVNFQEVKLT